MALISLIMLSLHRVLHSATRYYTKMTRTTDLQQSCILATSRLVTELLESNANSIRGDQTNHRFVSFGSPRNDAGEVSFDPTTTELEWHRYVGYYIENDQEEPVFYRKDRPLGTVAITPPNIPESYTDAFWASESVQGRVIARQVYYVDVVSTTSVSVIIGVRSRDQDFVVTIKTALKARN